MKKIIVIIFIFLSIFIIYINLQDDKIYYLSLGDSISFKSSEEYLTYSEYLKEYLEENKILENYTNLSVEDYRTTDLIKDIENNIIVNNKTLKNLLIKADIITLSIGYNDIISKFNKHNYYKMKELIDSYLLDLENLYIILRKYCKENIIMLGYYNIYELDKYNNQINYLVETTKELCKKYRITYIELDDMVNYTIDFKPTKAGQYIIFGKIKTVVDNILN